MAVALRLRRDGNKNRPYYRVVASDKRSPRDGKFIELLGTYDPKKATDTFTLKLERVEYWLEHGAQPSPTVASLIRRARLARKASPAPNEAPEVEAPAAA
jgi:small subunit ribosomal protein S16